MAEYVVGTGDTLTKIAREHGTTVEKLCELNGIKDTNKISVGQKLSLGEMNDTPKTPIAETTEMTPEQLAEQTEKAEVEANRVKNVRVAGTFENAGRTIDEGVAWCGEKFDEGLEIVGNTGKQIAQGVEDAYNAADKFVTETVPETIEEGAYVVTGAALEGAEKVSEFVTETVPETIEEGAYMVAGAALEGAEKVSELVTDTGKQIAQTAENAYDAATEFVADTGKQITQSAKKVVARADNRVRNVGRRAKQEVKGFLANAKVQVPKKRDRSQALRSSNTQTRLRARGEEAVENVKRRAAQTWNKAVDTVGNVASKVYNGARNLYNAIKIW